MNIIQCKICHKPFHSIGGNTCPDCMAKIDREYSTVRDYIYDNPNAKIDDVSKETGVEKAVILHLLKDGRLKLSSPDIGGALVCYICKKPISSGRMCEECKAKVALTMNKNIEANKPPQPEQKDLKASKHTAKMHTDISRRG